MPDEKPPIEEPAADEAAANAKPGFPPLVALAFVIIALLGALIVMALKNGPAGKSSPESQLAAIRAEADAVRSEYNRERIAMGLRPVEGGSEPIEDIASRLKKDADTLVALAGSYQKMLAENETEITAGKSELIRSEKSRQSLAAECARLQSELQRALVGGSDSELLRRDLGDLKSQRDALAAELAAARQKMLSLTAESPAGDYLDLKRRFDETLRAKEFFEARVKELEGDLSKAKLFASSESELLPAAVALFRNLRELEGLPDSEITSAYSTLAVNLGADVKKTLTFATGSSALAPADVDSIRGLIADIPDGDLIMAIGYASETGNVDGNRVLSSERATAAAEMISSIKRPGQLTQAVYLGQTDRFSSSIPERNQLVEIWHIRKR